MDIVVNLVGLAGILFIIWWFWWSQPQATRAKQGKLVEIHVKDGVYEPAYIEVPILQPITLRFIRHDATPCAETVSFHQLNITQELPLGHAVDIPIELKKEGEYDFTCEMHMYHGKLIGV